MDTLGLTQFKQKGQLVIQTAWISCPRGYALRLLAYANGLRFDSHLADFCFVFFFFFSGLGVTLTFRARG